ncbi:MAG: hypothetical protein GC164_12130 [Phycisphaera sp.]|nr:hypothetical protein [Phycisphaera sp.]
MTRFGITTLALTAPLLLAACGDRGANPNAQAQSGSAGAANKEVRQVEGEIPPCCQVDPASDQQNNALAQSIAQKVKETESATSVQSTPQPTQVSETAETPTASQVRRGDWIEPDKRSSPYNLDFGVTDQDGKHFQLNELVGKPIALTFIFTTCPNPNMCPLTSVTMADLEKRVVAAGLADNVQLLLFSYDPLTDTPEVLKKYAEEKGFSLQSSRFLRPDPDDFRGLLNELQIGFALTSGGQINHRMELLVLDARGRFVRDYMGDIWDNADVLDDLQKLVAEEKH